LNQCRRRGTRLGDTRLGLGKIARGAPRSMTAASTALAIATPALMAATTCSPWLNASRAALNSAAPSSSGN